jgi:lambda repressor-like predicted transcriptional regulator
MNKPREIVLELLQRRGISRADLAQAVGISVRSLENVLSGYPSKIARQRISALFGERNIWPGMATSGHLVRLPAGCEIEFTDEDQSLEFAKEFGANVTVRGRSVVFALPTRFIVELPIAITKQTNKESKNK